MAGSGTAMLELTRKSTAIPKTLPPQGEMEREGDDETNRGKWPRMPSRGTIALAVSL